MSTSKGEKRSIDNDNGGGCSIELLDNFRELRQSWPKDMERLFDPTLANDRRAALWEIMCEGGDALRQRFAWAIPDERALRILKHFSPIVEIGSGLGYWAMLLRARGADVRAYDKVSGAPRAEKSVAKKRSKFGESKDSAVQNETRNGGGEKSEDLERPFWTEVEKGGPEALEEACNKNRSLFLCYPDDFEGETESLGLQCLRAFEGDVVIHIGELFGDSVCMTPDQAPWGRTTSQECQEELASNFHCVLKVPLPSWPHSRDTLTVWKRNMFCSIEYGSEVDQDEDKQEEDDPTGEQDASKGGGGVVTAGAPELSSEKEEVKEDQCRDEADDSSEEDNSGSSADGFPDLDIYAFVPCEEQILSAQAAPSVKFLLDT